MDWATLWKDVLVPLGSAVLGGLFALLIPARSEWFRKLARWEPYGRELWVRRLDPYSKLATAVYTVTPHNLPADFENVFHDFERAYEDAFLLLGRESHSKIQAYKRTAVELLVAMRKDDYDPAEFETLWVTSASQVLNALRRDLIVDSLDNETVKAFKQHLKEQRPKA